MKHSVRQFAAMAALTTLASASVPAGAHVVLEYQVAPAGSAYRASFQVGHGCGASPTRQLAVSIPEGVRGARPMPKPGWSLEVVRGALAQPYTTHGRTIAEDVVGIVWTARTVEDMLPNGHYDEFVIAAQAPATAGTIYWPVRQLCAQGANDWTEIPAPGQPHSALKNPAPLLEVLPAGNAAGHNH